MYMTVNDNPHLRSKKYTIIIICVKEIHIGHFEILKDEPYTSGCNGQHAWQRWHVGQILTIHEKVKCIRTK